MPWRTNGRRALVWSFTYTYETRPLTPVIIGRNSLMQPQQHRPQQHQSIKFRYYLVYIKVYNSVVCAIVHVRLFPQRLQVHMLHLNINSINFERLKAPGRSKSWTSSGHQPRASNFDWNTNFFDNGISIDEIVVDGDFTIRVKTQEQFNQFTSYCCQKQYTIG